MDGFTTFSDRAEAGRLLGAHLASHGVRADIVLGLPRGGVVVAAGVAQALRLPLDIILVRKIGHPHHREFALGALAEGNVLILDQTSIDTTGVSERSLREVVAEERDRLEQYGHRFRGRPPPDLAGQTVLIVDDGLATGSTMEAAVASGRGRAVAHILVAVPVASDTAMERLGRATDQVEALVVDPGFRAVGAYYDDFPQTTDEEVIALLAPDRTGLA